MIVSRRLRSGRIRLANRDDSELYWRVGQTTAGHAVHEGYD